MPSPHVIKIPHGRIGSLVIATSKILKDEKIAEFDGIIYSWKNTVRSIPNYAPKFTRDHAIQIGEGTSRDSFSVARDLNHSCNPNCGIHNRIQIVAMQNIEEGTELTWDYAMTEDNDWAMKCECGEPNCRKLIAGYRYLPPERREAYEGYISDWLLEKPRPFLGHATKLRVQHPCLALPNLAAFVGS